MLTLRLPDGSQRQVPEGARPRDVAESIGKRLAQAAIAAKVNGTVVDLDRELPAGNGELSFAVLTDKDREALDVLRHSCAHIMARAVMRLFPGVQLAFGPAIENGFYYDIDVADRRSARKISRRIEAEMKKIVAAAEPFERFEQPLAEGKALCADLKQNYKVEHIDDELKKYPTLSFYRQGEFIDLCRGPHMPHAGKIGAFKLLSIAGAYWKNDASRKQLQRLYATAFFSQKDLDAYLHQLEEAKKRDHRVLGKQLKLFTISQLVGSGLILWMPKGATVRGTARNLHQGRAAQTRLRSRSTLRTSAGSTCIAPAAISPTIATPSFRRCTPTPRARPWTWPSTGWRPECSTTRRNRRWPSSWS